MATQDMSTDLVPVQPNICALARAEGVSRSTIRHRLKNGWQPPTTIEGEIITLDQSVTTTAATPLRVMADPTLPPWSWREPRSRSAESNWPSMRSMRAASAAPRSRRCCRARKALPSASLR